MEERLPKGFEALDPLVDEWCLPDSEARCRKRQLSSMEEIRTFYDRMIPEAARAVEALKDVPLGDMRREDENLLKLMLSLAEIGPAIEWYGQQQVYDGFDVLKLRWVRQIPDTERQFPAVQ